VLNISIVNIVCTILNLLILYWAFKKFLFGRVDAILERRKEEVDTASQAADKAIEEARATKKEYEEKLALADDEKQQILADIRKQGYEEYDKIVAEAQKKGREIIQEARHNAETEADRTKEVYASELKQMVIEAATKIAATKHSRAEDSDLYDKFIDEAMADRNG
jgi:F-type H+-transporting ATPase subunit b